MCVKFAMEKPYGVGKMSVKSGGSYSYTQLSGVVAQFDSYSEAESELGNYQNTKWEEFIVVVRNVENGSIDSYYGDELAMLAKGN